jgi:ABC-type microcin C transport system duplicated ATPase subunit YejF
MNNNIIIAKGISKTFTNKRGSTKVIEKIDLEVRENEFLCLVGPASAARPQPSMCSPSRTGDHRHRHNQRQNHHPSWP